MKRLTKGDLLRRLDKALQRDEIEALVRIAEAGYRPYVAYHEETDNVIRVGFSNPARDGAESVLETLSAVPRIARFPR